MTVERHEFATSDPTREEMLQLLRERVHRVYGLNLLQYARLRRHGGLPDVPGGAPLEVFAGDFGCAAEHATARAERSWR